MRSMVGGVQTSRRSCLPGRDSWRIRRAKSNGGSDAEHGRETASVPRPARATAASSSPTPSTWARRASCRASASRRWRRPARARRGATASPTAALSRDVMIEHIAEIAAASDVPVNADFLNGFADEPEDLIPNVVLCIEAGVAGLSIEDMGADGRLYDIELAVDRIRAARRAHRRRRHRRHPGRARRGVPRRASRPAQARR